MTRAGTPPRTTRETLQWNVSGVGPAVATADRLPLVHLADLEIDGEDVDVLADGDALRLAAGVARAVAWELEVLDHKVPAQGSTKHAARCGYTRRLGRRKS